jgi:myo-inositol-1(or 4)-monophosphatase
MSLSDLRRILHYAIDLSCGVGDYIYSKKSTKRKIISYKGEIDLVTQFDRRSQTMIIQSLKKRFPTFGILSEENVHHNADSSHKWIIDPLDGTTNFAHNLPIWAISLALEMKGDIVLGVVYDPTRSEVFSAIKNFGAFLNEKRIKVSKVKKLSRSLLITGFPYDIRRSKNNNLNHFNNFAVRAQAVRRLGSAALDLCYTACGRFDGYWELKLSPWDQAAGSLILEEAGGVVTDFKGRKFNIYGDEVLGTNGCIHRQMMRVLKL